MKTNSMMDQVDGVVGEAEQLMKSMANAAPAQAEALRANIETRIAQASDRLERLRAQTVQATDGYVRQDPWRAIGMSAAVAGIAGLVLGAWIARR